MNPFKPLLFAGLSLCILFSGAFSSASAQSQQDSGGSEQKNQSLDMHLMVIRLRHVDAEVFQSAAQTVIVNDSSSSTARMSVDPRTNALIVMAAQPLLDRLTKLAETLDQPVAEPKRPDAQPVNLVVRLVADEGISTSTPAEPRLQELIKEAGDSGLIRPLKLPQVLTHSLIQVSPGQQDSNQGRVAMASSSVENAVRLAFDGYLHEHGGDRYQLQTKIQIILQAHDANENAKPSVAEIQTDSVIPKDHPVLLSVNTIEGRDFLIVVEVR